ncbi:MAG TPA: hypothetical protein EYP08_07100, partial [Pyrodictiaceae archaeon]|nr:hypothetical protein [Pyrodictiaceae archaeon]
MGSTSCWGKRAGIEYLPADVQIGKKGIYEGVLKEIDRRLKEKGVVKVRILKSALNVEK